jgi:lysozyme
MVIRKKTKTVYGKVMIAAIGLIIICFMLLWVFNWYKQKESSRIRYAEFGIEIPTQYELHGIDVSRYQGTIAWDKVREMNIENIKLDFAFIKATEGVLKTDPLFRRNWKQSRKEGIVRGAYHFFIASKDGKHQARNFINMVDIEKGDLPPVLDVEQRNGRTPAQIRKEVKIWLNMVENHYGVKPIIYTNVDFYIRNLGEEFDAYPLWVAHYFQPTGPRIGRRWDFWQHSEQGRVNGIRHKVDFNVFKGSAEKFKSLLVK